MITVSGVLQTGTKSIKASLPTSVSGKYFLRASALAALCALAVFFISCSGGDAKTAAKANVERSVPVSVATAELRDMPYYLTGLGSVSAFYTVSIKSRVDGQLVEVKFKEGQFVKEGDLLAVIDPRPYEVQLEQAQAQLYKDQATLRDAKLNLQRYKDLLHNSGAMSQQQVDTQAATVDQLDGTVRTDQAMIDNVKLQLVYCHITAPVSGRIGLRLVDPGNMVHATDTNAMLVITQLQPIAVLFTLPEDNLPAVSQHMKAGTLTVEAYSRDNVTKLASGVLQTIDNQIDQTTGTGRLKAVFDNRNDELWPNQFVNCRLLLETKNNSTTIPAAAVQRGPQGTYVFVAKSDNTVTIRPVTLAFTQENVSVIASGLSPQEVVVTDGQDKLQEGSKVEPRQPAPPGGRSPQGSGVSAPGGQNSGGRVQNPSSPVQ